MACRPVAYPGYGTAATASMRRNVRLRRVPYQTELRLQDDDSRGSHQTRPRVAPPKTVTRGPTLLALVVMVTARSFELAIEDTLTDSRAEDYGRQSVRPSASCTARISRRSVGGRAGVSAPS